MKTCWMDKQHRRRSDRMSVGSAPKRIHYSSRLRAARDSSWTCARPLARRDAVKNNWTSQQRHAVSASLQF